MNVDDIYEAPLLPHPGETVVGATFRRLGGGKGANQAAAAATTASWVGLVGAVGNDAEGEGALSELDSLGVDVSAVARLDAATGRAAVITSSHNGEAENQIVVASGANGLVSAALVEEAIDRLDPTAGTVVLLSAEIPDDAIDAAATRSRHRGLPVIFNAAPARPLPPGLLHANPILVVNETEAEVLTGLGDVDRAAIALVERTGQPVIVTVGADGARVHVPDGHARSFAAPTVPQVADTTGAGDAFCGVFAAALASGCDIAAAVDAGQSASARAIARVGARAWLRSDEDGPP